MSTKVTVRRKTEIATSKHHEQANCNFGNYFGGSSDGSDFVNRTDRLRRIFHVHVISAHLSFTSTKPPWHYSSIPCQIAVDVTGDELVTLGYQTTSTSRMVICRWRPRCSFIITNDTEYPFTRNGVELRRYRTSHIDQTRIVSAFIFKIRSSSNSSQCANVDHDGGICYCCYIILYIEYYNTR